MKLDTERIKARREELTLTQTEAGKRAGMSKQAWCGIEKGRKPRISADTLHRIAVALSLRMEDLVAREGGADAL